MPPADERAERLAAVLQVLYLIFNEGYTSTHRTELADEAIRLTRMVHRLICEARGSGGRPTDDPTQPGDGEVAGLLALMLLTDARRMARTGPDGELIPLAEQDRRHWNRAFIAEGTELVTDAMSRTALGPYQLQAAIAAVHGEAARAEDTDWPQILALYDLLTRFSDNPMVALNRAVAVAMVRGPRAGLQLLDTLDGDSRLATHHHRLDAARAHLLELAGDHAAARTHYLTAARRTTSSPERRYLNARAARLPG